MYHLWKWFEGNLDAYEKTSLLGLFLPTYPQWGEISEVLVVWATQLQHLHSRSFGDCKLRRIGWS